MICFSSLTLVRANLPADTLSELPLQNVIIHKIIFTLLSLSHAAHVFFFYDRNLLGKLLEM